jgi:flagellin
MSLTVNTNIEAMDAQRNLNSTESSLSMSMQRLSSGLRINTAADDVAGYAISQTLQSQINGLGQAQQNTQDAVSLSQTAQGSLNEVEQMLQRVRELAVQYKNGTNSESSKEAIVSEVGQLSSEIERVGTTTQFNGINLLKESATISFQVGANDGEVIAVSTISLGESVGTISLGEGEAISKIDASIEKVSAAAGSFGAVQNRLQYTQSNLATYSENLSAAQSSIVDVDMASEMTNFTKDQVLEQAGVAVLSQANQLPQAVLKLLGS